MKGGRNGNGASSSVDGGQERDKGEKQPASLTLDASGNLGLRAKGQRHSFQPYPVLTARGGEEKGGRN